jgi:N-acetylglucosamine transport system permease protein
LAAWPCRRAFIHIKDFYLMDSRLGLVLIYTTLGIPFTVFILTAFFRTLPTALAESAAIDGASEYATFWHIFFPLAKPGIVTVSIFNFLFVWNEYQFALVFISNESLKTLPVGLYDLSLASQHSNNWTALFAGLVMLMIPTIIIFLILQDRITRGLTVGAIKE